MYPPGGGSALLPLVPIAVFAAAICMVGFAARRSRRSTASDAGAGHLRTLGLVTYPFYLIHNVVGAGAVRMLTATGLDAGFSVCITLIGLLALCWAFCVKVEPAIRALLRQILAYLGLRYRERTTGSAMMRGLKGRA